MMGMKMTMRPVRVMPRKAAKPKPTGKEPRYHTIAPHLEDKVMVAQLYQDHEDEERIKKAIVFLDGESPSNDAIMNAELWMNPVNGLVVCQIIYTDP
jgi:hypothetical protein